VFVPQWLMPGYAIQRLYSTDVLSVTANGTAADVVCAAFNIRYENLGGVNARLYSWDQIKPLVVNKVGILTAPVPSGTAGNWGAGYVLNSGDNRLHADTDYAILGYTTSRTVVAVSINGVDLGNLNVGGPGGPSSRYPASVPTRQNSSTCSRDGALNPMWRRRVTGFSAFAVESEKSCHSAP